MVTKLIDLSHWNQNADWIKIKAAGVDGVYLKCTQGLQYSDPVCLNHATRAKAQGIAVGYYHFATLTEDAAAESKYFLGRLSTLPQSDLMPVLDIEENKAGYTPSQVETWMHHFLDSMGQESMIYSYADFLNHNLPPTHQFGRYKLFLAQYRAVASPMLPDHGWPTADLWQFTNMGTVDGIAGTVDLSKPITQNFVL